MPSSEAYGYATNFFWEVQSRSTHGCRESTLDKEASTSLGASGSDTIFGIPGLSGWGGSRVFLSPVSESCSRKVIRLQRGILTSYGIAGFSQNTFLGACSVQRPANQMSAPHRQTAKVPSAHAGKGTYWCGKEQEMLSCYQQDTLTAQLPL